MINQIHTDFYFESTHNDTLWNEFGIMETCYYKFVCLVNFKSDNTTERGIVYAPYINIIYTDMKNQVIRLHKNAFKTLLQWMGVAAMQIHSFKILNMIKYQFI